MNNKKQYWKAYVVEFTNKISGNQFLKFGACNDRDVFDRFCHDWEQYQDYMIKPLASISPKYGNCNYKKMGLVEEYFLKKYPRNTEYLKNSFSGITETYKPSDEQERKKIIKEFYYLQKQVYANIPVESLITDTNNKKEEEYPF